MRHQVLVTLLVIFGALVLAACSSSKIPTNSPDVPSVDDSAIKEIKLEADPAQICNTLSPAGKILINYPCENQEISIDELNIKGKVLNLDKDVDLYILQDGSPVYSTSLTAIPTDASGDFKLLDGEIKLNTGLSGDAVLQILQDGEKVEVPVKIGEEKAE